jgi:dihydrofolate reductase
MKDKERLLSLNEPLRFIFSHSALREGWDNPNVFQICTLNETKSALKKRQEIGRGLRLPIDETGNRVFDTSINRLTVVANENYEDFARELQAEIETDCGIQFPKEYIDQASKRKKINLINKWRENADFLELWDRIKHKTRYSVHYSTEELIRTAADAVRQMPVISKPNIVTQKRGIEITQQGVTTSLFAVTESNSSYGVRQIPDVIGYIQRETELTRGAIVEILISSGRLNDLWINPQQFLDHSAKSIRSAMEKMMVDGIKYEKVAGAEYEMLLFEQKEMISYINRMIPVNNSIYEAIEFDSEVQNEPEEINMRKVILFMHASLDGFVAGPNGEMDWIIYDEELQNYATEVHRTVDTVLYGRMTYQMMAGFWSNLPESLLGSKYHVEHARWLENATKIAFSKSLDQVEWKNSRLVKENIAEEISTLKQQSGKDMIIIGSARFAQSLMRLGLIDEYRINVNPVVLGGGIPLFKDVANRIHLKLEKANTFNTGVVGLVYQTVTKE